MRIGKLIRALPTVVVKVEPAKYAAAVAQYKTLFAVKPNFEMPFYTGFTVGQGFEFGITLRGGDEDDRVTGYWEVGPRVEEVHAALVAKGAKGISDVHEVGDGIRLAELRDPFGNPIGIIHNPTFAEKYHLGSAKKPPKDYSQKFKGYETLTIHVDDVKKATKWYSEAFGVEPVYEDVDYVGFNFNGFNFGIMPKRAGVDYANPVAHYFLVGDKDKLSKKQSALEAHGHAVVGKIKSVSDVATLMELRDPIVGIVYGVAHDPKFLFDSTLLKEVVAADAAEDSAASLPAAGGAGFAAASSEGTDVKGTHSRRRRVDSFVEGGPSSHVAGDGAHAVDAKKKADGALVRTKSTLGSGIFKAGSTKGDGVDSPASHAGEKRKRGPGGGR